uniref:Uncharacterized protein LOC111104898 n=1 Tax=Crassostrea virginica TaxID=6565 RepID=A0A8B8AUL4_CRAVI|nr:uncharacterized protein LOC111104898 [Crassostrea virginica]
MAKEEKKEARMPQVEEVEPSWKNCYGLIKNQSDENAKQRRAKQKQGNVSQGRDNINFAILLDLEENSDSYRRPILKILKSILDLTYSREKDVNKTISSNQISKMLEDMNIDQDANSLEEKFRKGKHCGKIENNSLRRSECKYKNIHNSSPDRKL